MNTALDENTREILDGPRPKQFRIGPFSFGRTPGRPADYVGKHHTTGMSTRQLAAAQLQADTDAYIEKLRAEAATA